MALDLTLALGESVASPGWGNLGAALGGDYAAAGDAGLDRMGKMEKLLHETHKMREESRARRDLREQLRTAGVPENQVGLIEAVTLGGMGTDFKASMGGLGELQDQQLVGRATDAAVAGDIDLANALTIPMTGDPLERTKIAGQNVYDPYADPTQPLVTTEQGMAEIARDEAAATKSLRPPAPKPVKPPVDPRDKVIFEQRVKDVIADYNAKLEDPTVDAELARTERDKALEALGVPSRTGGATSREDFIRAVETDMGRPLNDRERASVVQQPDGSWMLGGEPLSPQEIATESAKSKAEGAQAPPTMNVTSSNDPIPVTDPTVAAMPTNPSKPRNGPLPGIGAPLPGKAAPAAPKTQAEYDALPSGALFIDPDDGRTYRKP